MNEQAAICATEGCRAPATSLEHCFGHLDDSGFEAAVGRIKSASAVVDVRGAPIVAARVERILSELRGAASATVAREVDLRGAHIQGDLRISNLRLNRPLRFAGARVEGVLTLDTVTGLRWLQLGAPASPRTSVQALHVGGCHGDDERLELAEADIWGKTRLSDLHLRYLGIDRCYLGELVLISDVAVDDGMDLLESAFGTLNAERARAAGPVQALSLYASTVNLDRCTFDASVDVLSCCRLTAKRCTFADAFGLRWRPPESVREHLKGEGRFALRLADRTTGSCFSS